MSQNQPTGKGSIEQFKNVTITPTMIADAKQALIKARMKMIIKQPFFGQLALRLELVPADPKWCPTAATDGRKFYYNPAFVLGLNDRENVFLVAHEIGHCIYEHFIRIDNRDPKLWNIANDYVINNMLDNELVRKSQSSHAEVIKKIQIYLDHKYDGWTSEEVFDDLLQQKNDGKNPEDEGEMLDVHIDLSGSGGDEDSDGDGGQDGDKKDGGDKDGLAKKPTKGMTEEERKQLQNDMRDAMIQAAQSVDAGNVPGDVKRIVGDLIEPQMDWREIIRAQIESSLKSNFTWMRPNRKGWHMSAVLPGMDRDQKIDICLCIDTSGSISQTMLRDFVSEVAGIMDQYEDYRIRIWQFDTDVYGYDEFTADDGRQIDEYEIKGGGGTDFEANWTYMKEHEIEPDQLIMFTDGCPWNSWGDPDYCDTVFLIHDCGFGGRGIEAPFGQTVYYDVNDKSTK